MACQHQWWSEALNPKVPQIRWVQTNPCFKPENSPGWTHFFILLCINIHYKPIPHADHLLLRKQLIKQATNKKMINVVFIVFIWVFVRFILHPIQDAPVSVLGSSHVSTFTYTQWYGPPGHNALYTAYVQCMKTAVSKDTLRTGELHEHWG